MKAAAHTLINTCCADGGSPDVKIALVPFEGDVNVGPVSLMLPMPDRPLGLTGMTMRGQYNGQNFGR